MKEYIEREAATKALCNSVPHSCDFDTCDRLCQGVAALDSVPAADVRPVVRGKWKNNHCSACGMMPMGEEIWECCDFAPPKFEWFMNFCPSCGACMEES